MYWLHRQGYTYTEDEKTPLQNATENDVFTAFSGASYWSSTEYGEPYAWNVHFSSGGVSSNVKHLGYAVRAVAAF